VFSADLNGLCKQESIAAKRLVAKSNRPAKLAAVITTFVPRFQALTAPGALSEAYAQFLANVQTEINALRANAGPAFKEANAKSAILAKKLHAPACA